MKGEELKNILEKKGISVKQFADYLAMSERAIQYWLSGLRDVPHSVQLIVRTEEFNQAFSQVPVNQHNHSDSKTPRENGVTLSEAVKKFSGYIKSVCLSDNTLDCVLIVDFCPAIDEVNLKQILIFEEKSSNALNDDLLASLEEFILAERKDYLKTQCAEDGFQKQNSLTIAWSRMCDAEFLFLASRGEFPDGIFRQAVRDVRGSIAEKYNALRQIMKRK